jgi:Uma2 family endonuclease
MSTFDFSSVTNLGSPSAPVPLHRLTVEQYHSMIDAGVFTEHDKVELIEGLLIEMSPIRRPHSYVVQQLAHILGRLTAGQWEVFQQQPVTLATSEPEPDLSVVRGTNEDYKTEHPVAAQIGLVIEVADSTLAFDRNVKSKVYAAAGIPEYWLVNLPKRQVEAYRDPRAGESESPEYQPCEVIAADGTLALVLDGHRFGDIAVASFLP